MLNVVYIGDGIQLDFAAENSGGEPINLTDAEIWVAIKRRRNDADPALVVVANALAGGSDSVVATLGEPAEGRFRATLRPVDTAGLEADKEYIADGIVRLPDGMSGTVGTVEFRAKHRVLRTLAPPA